MDTEGGNYDDSGIFGLWPTIIGVLLVAVIVGSMFALATGMR